MGLENITKNKNWIWILLGIILLIVIIYFFMRNKNNSSTPPKVAMPSYTQVLPIDQGGCDANKKDINGNPCTPYVVPVLTITKATYGNASGSKIKDVTSILQSYVSNGSLNLKALSNGQLMNDLFTDVAPNEKKVLLVTYTLDSVKNFKSFNDNESIIIP